MVERLRLSSRDARASGFPVGLLANSRAERKNGAEAPYVF